MDSLIELDRLNNRCCLGLANEFPSPQSVTSNRLNILLRQITLLLRLLTDLLLDELGSKL